MKNLRNLASHGLKALKVWLKDMKGYWVIKSKSKYTQNQWLAVEKHKLRFEVGLFFKSHHNLSQGQTVNEMSGFFITVFSESYIFRETRY